MTINHYKQPTGKLAPAADDGGCKQLTQAAVAVMTWRWRVANSGARLA